MNNRWEIRLSGTGGQGLIMGGIVLAEAAVIEGKNVVQSQVYGPEARGGASRADVIIDDEEIDYPKVIKPNLLLTMSQEAFVKYKDDLAPEGWHIYDSSFIEAEITGKKVYGLPITIETRKAFQTDVVGNMVALGVLVELTGVVTIPALKKAVVLHVPKGSEKLNLDAVDLGINMAKSLGRFENEEAQRNI